MSNVNYSIGFSPYRNSFRQERMREISEKKAALVSEEVVKVQISSVTIIIALFIVSLAIGALYLLNFNKVATKGYILKRLEVSRQELQQQNDIKTLGLADAKAMSQIIESGALNGMRKPGEVSYVFGETGVLAKAD